MEKDLLSIPLWPSKPPPFHPLQYLYVLVPAWCGLMMATLSQLHVRPQTVVDHAKRIPTVGEQSGFIHLNRNHHEWLVNIKWLSIGVLRSSMVKLYRFYKKHHEFEFTRRHRMPWGQQTIWCKPPNPLCPVWPLPGLAERTYPSLGPDQSHGVHCAGDDRGARRASYVEFVTSAPGGAHGLDNFDWF